MTRTLPASTAPARLLVALVVALAALVVGAAPASASTAPPDDATAVSDLDVGGVLFVSGVRTSQRPAWNPLGGVLHLEITVRNATDQVLDASVSYGATTLLGVDLGGANSLAVRDLDPGEVRVVPADVRGVGQWGVVRAHMTVRPPAEFRGVDLPPLQRDRWVLVPPWYVAGLVVLAVVAVLLLRRFPVGRSRGSRRRRRSRPPSGARPAVAS